MIRVVATELDGVVELTPPRFGDDRGWFSEVWHAERFAAAGIDIDWVQDNESLSGAPGTVRGLHFQIEPMAQHKLVRVLSGRIFDVAVDLRRSSPTFAKWTARELSADKGNQMFIPKGFGHGFCTLVPDCKVSYKVSAFYSAEHDRAIRWDDADIDIRWPAIADESALSAKDLAAPQLADAPVLF